jgi:hypothetical protein
MQVVQQLLDLQSQRMKTLEEEFERQLMALEGEFEAERADVAATHSKHKKEMYEVVHAMQLGFHELESDVRQVCPSVPCAHFGTSRCRGLCAS